MILPRSLFGRFLIIIIVPNIIMQLVAVFIFFERHWDGVSKHMASSLVDDYSLVVTLVNQAEIEEVENVLKTISNNLAMKAQFEQNNTLRSNSKKMPSELFNVQQHLLRRLPYPFTLNYNENKDISFVAEIDNGTLTIITSRKRLINPSTYVFVAWIIITSLVLLTIAILFARTQIRSIRHLSMVAGQFGRGQDIGDFKPSGALEVRRAGNAFLMMKSRINRQIQQRTEMLSGVSHDLKTPLTRMKLQLAMMEENEDVKALQVDASEMERMLNEYLDFAKSREKGPISEINMSDLIRSVVAGYRHHHDRIDLTLSIYGHIIGNASSLRRAMTNLIDNGLRYGSHVWVSGEINDDDNIIITVEDNGPGIPASKRKEVFQPFYRIDSSRNLDNVGTGLGLSITKDSIVSHGGSIILDESDKGGLKAIITLPV